MADDNCDGSKQVTQILKYVEYPLLNGAMDMNFDKFMMDSLFNNIVQKPIILENLSVNFPSSSCIRCSHFIAL